MSGKSKRKRARRRARAAAAQQQAERARIQAETQSMQRSMGEELAGRRRARMRGGVGLLSAARMDMGTDEETLG